MKSISVILCLLLLSLNLKAEVIYEAYYKVSQFKKHIGFAVLRHEIDEKTKNFKTTSYSKLSKLGFDMTESYQAVSTEDLVPVSLSYLAAGKKQTKTIEATIKNMKMTGLVVENKKKIKLDTPLPKGAFFSSALYYLILQSKDGLKAGTKFDYVGVSEEGPVPINGTVSIDKNMVTQGTQQLFKTMNNYAGADYESLVSVKGEVVSTVTPSTQIETELVKTAEEATDGIKIGKGTLEKIFGNKPEGKINPLYAKTK